MFMMRLPRRDRRLPPGNPSAARKRRRLTGRSPWMQERSHSDQVPLDVPTPIGIGEYLTGAIGFTEVTDLAAPFVITTPVTTCNCLVYLVGHAVTYAFYELLARDREFCIGPNHCIEEVVVLRLEMEFC